MSQDCAALQRDKAKKILQEKNILEEENEEEKLANRIELFLFAGTTGASKKKTK